ncbi:hypothetical protein K435DRAFT_838587 [Dendrothele bispora CBS 962.96]|uniref:F-box domain-containing protein n=1 Tax=Dendrothele bispora (strain CBS 962.96) TaxID=1314807 RepID=A0A4S8M5J5_DENBC|nr:hypothetical protein K435DRAFT_838587 [Dendrothele bispora CBS 962.96]
MSAIALSCHDIVEQIIRLLVFTEKDENDNVVIRKQDVLSCALACRSFLGPALSVLWYSLSSLVPLLKLLPNFKAADGYYSLTGKIEEKDWTNFDAHAKLVREFTYTDIDSPDHTVLPSVYLRLAQFRPKPLPHLLRFTCSCSTAAISETLLFLSPILERVEFKDVNTLEKRTNVEMFLSFLVHESISLQSLCVSGTIPKNLLSIICHFSQLRSLELLGKGGEGPNSDNDMDEEDLIQIGLLLPHLNKLSLEANLSSSTDPEKKDFEMLRPFSNLHELNLHGSASSITRALQIISPDTLHKLSFHIPESPESSSPSDSQPQIQHILSQVTSRWSQTLSSLKIHLTDGTDPYSQDGWGSDDESNDNDTSTPLSLSQLLHPMYLSSWPFLSSLSVTRALFNLTCSNSEITSLVTTWGSSLKHLELSFVDTNNNNNNSRYMTTTNKHSQLPTLSSLYTIAQHCPNLVSLQITLNLRDLPKDLLPNPLDPLNPLNLLIPHTPSQSSSSFIPHPSYHHHHRHHHHLQHLFINTSHAVQDTVLFIHHLDTLFPHLQSLIGRKDAQSDWTEIQRILKLCQRVRAFERCRLKKDVDMTFG